MEDTERPNILGISIDHFIKEQITYEKKRWGEILTRGIEVILFLTKQNCAFRVHFESLHFDGNHGNFLELMKRIARYDPRIIQKWLRIIRIPFTICLINSK